MNHMAVFPVLFDVARQRKMTVEKGLHLEDQIMARQNWENSSAQSKYHNREFNSHSCHTKKFGVTKFRFFFHS